MAEHKLTERQQRFVEAYAACGNASEAARKAGYKGDANTVGPRLLANVGVKAALGRFVKKRRRAAILTLNQRHEILSKIAINSKAKHADRIRACEVLMRANGEFASVAVVTPPGTPPVVVAGQEEGEAPIVTIYLPNNGRSSEN